MSHPKIISRSEALSQGLKRYFTGKPCKHGHVAERLSSDRSCMECAKIKGRIYHSKNKDGILQRQRNYHIENQNEILERHRKYIKDNPHISRANTAKRRAAKMERTPPWANLEAIKEIYANCPEGYHVDHVHPLQGENISGLHVENNLQYLTPEENLRKGNRFNTD